MKQKYPTSITETENSFEAQLIKCWNVIILDHTYSQISMDVKTTRNVKQTVHPLTKFYSQAPSWTSSFKFHQNVKLIWTVKRNKKKNIKNDNGYMHKYIQRENKKEIERKNFLLWS